MKKIRNQCRNQEQARQQRRQKFYASSKSGFTIIELTLSMAFIGVLLITIAIIITNITAIYQKGLALKAVNSVGRSLTDEFTRAIDAGQAVNIEQICNKLTGNQGACKDENAFKFVYQEVVGSVVVKNAAGVDQPTQQQLGGIFCAGDYSYIWNTAQGIKNMGSNNGGIKLTYKDKDGNNQSVDHIHLLRVRDPDARVCSAMVNGNYEAVLPTKESDYDSGFTIDITELPNVGYGSAEGLNPDIQKRPYLLTEDPASGFLTDFDLTLELYQLRIFPVAVEGGKFRRFMSGTFILGTKNGGINIQRGGDYCDVNDGSLQNLSSDFNYCAINKFNFAGRTAGGNS